MLYTNPQPYIGDAQPLQPMRLVLLATLAQGLTRSGAFQLPRSITRSAAAGADAWKRVRGGSSVETQAALADYSAAAANLFGNMRTPAALAAGAVITLGFAASPKPSQADSRGIRALKQLHCLIAVASLVSQFIVVEWATICVNKLTEIDHEPTLGVLQLLQRDYELAWLGCNVHFLGGLLGLCVMTGTHVFLEWGAGEGVVAALTSSAGMCLMLSAANVAIELGSGVGLETLGKSFAHLALRYLYLLVKVARQGRLLVVAAGLLGTAGVMAAADLLAAAWSPRWTSGQWMLWYSTPPPPSPVDAGPLTMKFE